MFYRLFGLGDLVFTFAAVGHGVGVVATLIGICLVDKVGRRPLIIFGAVVLVVCNFTVGSVGSRQNLSSTDVNAVVACMILILTAVKISFQANACESCSPDDVIQLMFSPHDVRNGRSAYA